MAEKTKEPQEGSQCLHCFNYDDEYPGTCPAFFPDPIPDNILSGETTHEKPVAGQKIDTILFDPDNEYKYPSL